MAKNEKSATGAARTRAAPSPTGKQHIGNFRTYIWDYLLSHKTGGQFLLRIENTDEKRTVDYGNEILMEMFHIYGLNYDEGPDVGGPYAPYVQLDRLDIYRKYAQQLLDSDHAYYCFCTEERLDELRKEQVARKEAPGYDRKCRALSYKEAKERVDAGEAHVIRLKFPLEGESRYEDVLYGQIKVDNRTIDDQVLVKTTGVPTYFLAAPVDDHEMNITHVLRGAEWTASSPKYFRIFEVMGWEKPVMLHVPVILAPAGQKGKLSKRNGALPAVSYLRKGYLPVGIVNYLTLIGWSPDPKVAKQDEVYTIEELIEIFDPNRIQKSPGRYDIGKLNFINAQHVKRFSADELVAAMLNWAENIVLAELYQDKVGDIAEWEAELIEKVRELYPKWKNDLEYFKKVIGLVQDRIQYFEQFIELSDFFYAEKLSWTDESWQLKEQSKSDLANALEVVTERLEPVFAGKPPYSHEEWEKIVRGYADELGWKHGALFLALRSAITGKLQSPPLLEDIEVIGWDRAKDNINAAINWLREG